MKEVRMVRKKQDHPVSDPPKDPGMGAHWAAWGRTQLGGGGKADSQEAK